MLLMRGFTRAEQYLIAFILERAHIDVKRIIALSFRYCGMKFGIGQAVRRVEDQRFLIGEGSFVDDFALTGMCHAVAVMSPHAHALIRKIDVSTATRAPGVVCVLTGADVTADGLGGIGPLFMPEDIGFPKGFRTSRPILVSDKVRCSGDRVAFIVAETLAQARDAAELIEIEYEAIPAVVELQDAVAAGAPTLWDECPGNIAFKLEFGGKPATDAAFAKAAYTVSLQLENNRLSGNPIEPRSVVGQFHPASDSFTLHSANQNPHGLRSILAGDVFHIPESKIRVISPDVGGGFGVKTPCYPEDALVLWAAKRCRRPVKWIASRSDALLGDNHGRNQIVDGEIALDEHGRILAVRANALHAFGAYMVGSAVAPMVFSMRFIPSVYDFKAAHLVTNAVFTNTAPLTSYRGAGRPEAAYLIERLLDKAARKIGIDPVEIRRRNFICPDALPYTTATGFRYDSGEFEQTMDLCLQRSDWDHFEVRRNDSKNRGKVRGRGLAYFIEQGGVFNDRMELHFDPTGGATIVAGTHSHGQGHATTYAQLVSEWLGIPFDSINLIQGDTKQVPFGRGTYAARSSMVGGCALMLAVEEVVERARKMAGFLMECEPGDVTFKDGAFKIAGTDRSMPFVEVAKAFYRRAGIPKELGVGLAGSGTFGTEPPNFPNGCHACEVEIDLETGAVQLVRYTSVDDAGRVINPMICAGQIHGGIAQGVGQALLEHVIYSADSGQLLSGSFMDYAMPKAANFPNFESAFNEVPCKTNPLGIKGVGEAGTIGAPPAVINAILDALAPYGVESIDMPATPSRIWGCLQKASHKRDVSQTNDRS